MVPNSPKSGSDPAMVSLVRWIEAATRFFGLLGAWLCGPLILTMVWEVFSRYVLSTPTIWAYEIGYMLMGAGLMFGIGYAAQTRSHVRVDFLYGALSERKKALIDLIGLLLLLPMVLWLVSGLWHYLGTAYASGERSGESFWNPVVWPFRVTFVLGFVLFAMQIIAEIVKAGHVLLHGEPLPVASDTHTGRPA